LVTLNGFFNLNAAQTGSIDHCHRPNRAFADLPDNISVDIRSPFDVPDMIHRLPSSFKA
jgi:hypothetical protein